MHPKTLKRVQNRIKRRAGRLTWHGSKALHCKICRKSRLEFLPEPSSLWDGFVGNGSRRVNEQCFTVSSNVLLNLQTNGFFSHPCVRFRVATELSMPSIWRQRHRRSRSLYHRKTSGLEDRSAPRRSSLLSCRRR